MSRVLLRQLIPTSGLYSTSLWDVDMPPGESEAWMHACHQLEGPVQSIAVLVAQPGHSANHALDFFSALDERPVMLLATSCYCLDSQDTRLH